jgi:hypothetical protein
MIDLFFSYFLLLVGFALSIFGLLMLGQSALRIIKWKTGFGNIVRYKTHYSDGQKYYFPYVSYTTSWGESFTFESQQGRGTKNRKENKRVSVLYNPSNPEDAQIKSWSNLWMFPSFILGLSSAFIIGGMVELGLL